MTVFFNSTPIQYKDQNNEGTEEDDGRVKATKDDNEANEKDNESEKVNVCE
jgi:hypothetical protein